MRALYFALVGNAASVISNLLPSPDIEKMVNACRAFGAKVEGDLSRMEIQGVGGNFPRGEKTIECGNSGLIFRLMGAIAATRDDTTHFTGDRSIQKNRPIEPLIDGIVQLGGGAEKGEFPLTVYQRMKGGKAVISGVDSQPVSALLMAAPLTKYGIDLTAHPLGEAPFVEMTLEWLERLGISYLRLSENRFKVQGNQAYPGFNYHVPGDFSTACVIGALGLGKGCDVTVSNLSFSEKQGDRVFFDHLESFGARVEKEETSLRVLGGTYSSFHVDLNTCIDQAPLLAAIACQGSAPSILFNGESARNKESDRLLAIKTELEKMGGRLELDGGSLTIYPSKLRGAKVLAHQDHRIAMALFIAAQQASGETEIEGADWIGKSFPGFEACVDSLSS